MLPIPILIHEAHEGNVLSYEILIHEAHEGHEERNREAHEAREVNVLSYELPELCFY